MIKKIKDKINYHFCGQAIFAIATMLFLQSCVPAKFSGYMPTGSGDLEAGYCVSGISDRLQVIANDGVIITLRANEQLRDNTIHLDITLWIPPGVTVQFSAPDFVIRSQEWLNSRNLTLYEITSSGPMYYSPLSELHGGGMTERRLTDGTSRFYSAFNLNFKKDKSGGTTMPKVTRFELQFPELLINSKKYSMSPVKFSSYTKWGVYTCAQ